MGIGGGLCAHIEHTSTYLSTLVNKHIMKNKRNFMVIDIGSYTVFTPKFGLYECSDIHSLKEFALDVLKKIDIDRVYIAKNVDEKWISENLYVFTLENSDFRKYILNSLGKILNVLQLRKKTLLSMKRIEPEAVLSAIDLYTKY